MAPVVWTGRSGDEVETVVAVLLSRRFPRAERITASQGDGGIDVQVPVGDSWDIYQIKGFNRFRRDQVERSFNRLRSYAAENSIKVASWNLLTLLNPSKEARKFLTELTRDAGFPCSWPGKIYVDGLAADYPSVIEYYFGDGKERLHELISQVANFRNTAESSSAGRQSPVQPGDVEFGLRDIFRALNDYDPHFLYAFSVTPHMPPIASDAECVFQQTSEYDGCFVTYTLYPRYREALIDRQLTVQAVLEASPEAQPALQDFFDYGAPLDTAGIVGRITADLPGGLGGDVEIGRIRIGPTFEQLAEPDRTLRLQIVDPNEVIVAEIRIRQRPPTMGLQRRGVRTFGSDEGECFTFETRFETSTQVWSWRFDMQELSGKHPSRILPGLRFLDALHSPNSLRVAAEYGPATAAPMPVPDADEALALGPIIRLAEALTIIQGYTPMQVGMPDPDQVNENEWEALLRSAAVLRDGEARIQVKRFESQFDSRPAGALDGGPQNLTAVMPHVLTIEGQLINLGYLRFYAANVSVEWAPVDGTDQVGMVLSPFHGTSFEMRFVREGSGAGAGDSPAT